jgi:hypothetical protein
MLQVMQATRYDSKADVIAINEPEYDQFLAVFTQSIVSTSEQLYDEIGSFLPCQASLFPGVVTNDLVTLEE